MKDTPKLLSQEPMRTAKDQTASGYGGGKQRMQLPTYHQLVPRRHKAGRRKIDIGWIPQVASLDIQGCRCGQHQSSMQRLQPGLELDQLRIKQQPARQNCSDGQS